MNTPQKLLAATLVVASASIFSLNKAHGQTQAVNALKYDKYVPKWQRLLLPDRVSHFSTFNGPSLNGNGNPNTFDGQEDSGGQSSWHQVSMQYEMDNGYRFVFNPRFVMEYGPEQEGEDRYKLDNPVFGITGLWYKNGNFTFSGGLNTVAYVFDEGDREDGLLFNPGGFQSLNYKVNNQVDVGSWVWARFRYFQNNSERSRLPMFVAPYASYTVNDKLSFTGFYQYNGIISNDVERVEIDPDDTLNFLTSYTINKYITIQPIVTLYRETEMNIADGNLNVWISGRFY
jgi:hypothetical protein